MKLNEFKKIEEGILSSMFGDYGSGVIKSAMSGKSAMSQMSKDMFVKDFLDDASTALDSAIQGGLINPSLQAAQKTAKKSAGTKAASGGAAPASGGAAPASGGAAPAAPAAPASGGAKPAGPAAPAGTAPSYKSQKVSAPLQKSAFDVKATGYQQKPNLRRVKENQYFDRLDYIFETIIDLSEKQNQQLSISQYLKKMWYPNYMKNVNYQGNPQVDKLINDVQASYGQDKGKAALNKLALTSYALSYNTGAVPAGAKNVETKNKQQGQQQPQQQPQQQQPSQVQPLAPNQLLAQLLALKQSNQAEFNKLITKLSAASAPAGKSFKSRSKTQRSTGSKQPGTP